MAHLAIELPADMVAGLRAVAERAADASYRRIADALVVGEHTVLEGRIKLKLVLGTEQPICTTESMYKSLEWDVKQILVNWHRAPTMKTGYGRIHTSDPAVLCEALREVAGLDATHERNQHGALCVRVNGFISPEWEARSKSSYAAPFHRVLYRSLQTSLGEKQRKIELLRADLEAREREFATIRDLFEDLRAITAVYTESPQTPEAHAEYADARVSPDPVHPAPASASHQTD
jgi:hypothetical protein